MRPRDDSIRIMSASAGISMEKTRTGPAPSSISACSARFMAKLVSHGGTPGDDHQIRRLQTAGHAVQIREARGQTGNGLEATADRCGPPPASAEPEHPAARCLGQSALGEEAEALAASSRASALFRLRGRRRPPRCDWPQRYVGEGWHRSRTISGVGLNIADARRALCELRQIGVSGPGGAAQVFRGLPHG